MLYSCCIAGPIKANNCPTTPFKIGIPRNPGQDLLARATAYNNMASAWIAHVKKYATEHKITYREALKKAGETYKKIK